MLKIERFTVENLTGNCVTDNTNPRFSFTLESDGENVTMEKAVLSLGSWKTETDSQIGIAYEGPMLAPFCTYEAQLTVTDNRGETAQAAVAFETGRMETPWQGKWITDGDFHFTEKKISPVPMTFRRKIHCKKAVASARIYTTALGIYELSLNGNKVGKDYFAPGLTSYEHSLQYQTYDVTSMLQQENELLAVVGGGWAVGAFTFSRANRITAPRQAFLGELHITYADGSKEMIGTDENWQVTGEGNYRYGDFYDGEIYDATIQMQQCIWHDAQQEKIKINPRIVATYGSLVQAHEYMKPVSCTRSKSGMLIYDFGQNFAGVIQAKIKGRAGQKIVFRHSEILMDGELFLEPLRSAKVSAVYTCREGEQIYSPRLTYMGFQYVGVTGIEAEDLELTALALYSDMEERGSFRCSHPLINRLQESIRWSTKSNFMDIPTDCPQRDERMGWTGDIALFAPTACYNFDTRRFLEKWLQDMKAEQRPLGGINVVIPAQGFNYPFAVVAYWGDSCILVPWAMYQAYGDIAVLKEMYPVMKKYLKAVKFWAGFACLGRTNRHTWRWWHQYGDWVAPEVSMWRCMNRGLWTATACWSNSCRLMVEIAGLLGEEEDAAHYTQLKQEIDRAYSKRFLDEEGRMKKQYHPFSVHALGKEGEFQSGYVLPIAFNMLTPEKKEGALKNLSRLVREADYHIRTGFPGTPFILFALADNGYEEDAFKMLMQESCPSWLYEAKVGTTIWERWDALREDGSCNTGADDGTNGMTSFNHYASGAVGEFLYRRIAGIEPLAAGYGEFRIQPLVGGSLTWATGSVLTPYGTIVSDWKLEGDSFTVKVQVPVGTRCHLVLPNGEKKLLGSGSYSYTCPYEKERKN